MDSNAMPAIRLEVQHMKAAIMHHLGVHGSELGEALDKQIMKAIDEYPWEDKVRTIAYLAIDETLESYFKYGNGRTAIYDAIDEAVKGIGNGTN